MKMLKRRGLRGQPWRTPLSTGKGAPAGPEGEDTCDIGIAEDPGIADLQTITTHEEKVDCRVGNTRQLVCQRGSGECDRGQYTGVANMVEAGDGGSGRHVEVTSNHHWAIEGGDSIEAVEEETKIRAFTRGVDVGRNDNEGMGAIGDADCQCRIIGSRADQGCGVVAVNGDEKTIAALVGERAREDFIVGESDGGISREASFLEEEHGRPGRFHCRAG